MGNTPKGTFEVFDLNGTHKVTDKFSVSIWIMLRMQKGGAGAPGTFAPADGDMDRWHYWSGYNLYLMYQATDKFSLGFRAEYFDNKQGVRGLRNCDRSQEATDVGTFTLTGTFKLADGHLQLKPEFGADIFNKLAGAANAESQQFMDSKGTFTKNAQSTLGIAAIYSF